MTKIFQGVIFQLSRQLQVFLQKSEKEDPEHWRPSVICISEHSFKRTYAFDLMKWISKKYGFGTYLHFIKGYVSKETTHKAKESLTRLINMAGISKSNVFIDTLISPSYTTAVAQSIQLPGVSGKENNMFLFEFHRNGPEEELETIIENLTLTRAASFDIGILSSTDRGFGFKNEIHIWITQSDYENANLMILLGYIILGHRDWKNAEIKIFSILPAAEIEEQRTNLLTLVKEGRLPISAHNIEVIMREGPKSHKEIINEKSKEADLIIVGFLSETLKQLGPTAFQGYEDLANILFISSSKQKEIS